MSRLCFRLFLACLVFLRNWSPSFAQDMKTCEQVSMAGVEIICFHQGIGSFSAKDRAEAVTEKIQSLAAKPEFNPDTLKIRNHLEFIDIVAGDIILLSILDDDVEKDLAGDKEEMARSVMKQMQSSVAAERALNAPTQLIRGLAYLLLATLTLLALLYLMAKVYERLYDFIRNSHGKYIKSLRIQSFELLNSARIIAVLLWLAKLSRVLLSISLVYIYVPLVLSFFPWTSNWAPKLLGYILNPLKTIWTVAINFIPNLFFIFAIIMLTRYMLKFTRFLFHEVELGHLQLNGFYKEWASPTYKLVRVLILAFAFIMTFPYLPGSSSPAFQGISVFLGLLLSLGSSSAIANVVAGIVITYMRPFKIGDRVKIADTTGDIIEKNLLVTRIRSIKNVEITVPNSMVLGSHIVNYSSTSELEGLILTTTVTIGYDVPWRMVHQLLKDAAKRTDLIIQDKQPYVLQTALNDFYVSYELNAFTHSPNKMAAIYSELHQNIQDCFCEGGVEIMSPHYRAVRNSEDSTIPTNMLIEKP
ncbi:MAG: mechanosensitive ion channel family protein [Proteobacteria bacterium]|nr:MAG: mechanosensitive ion channel family protein [Pseudomonadota bacterium]